LQFPDTHTATWQASDSRTLLGTNGTEAMAVLLAENKSDLVDYLKVGPFMGHQAIAALSAFPMLLHLDDALSSHQPLADEQLKRVESYVVESATPWTSAHIGFGVAEVSLDSALITQPSSALLDRSVALSNISRNARQMQGAITVPLLLENLPLFPNHAHLHICEPDLISTVISQTGCGLLLDVAHARVSADILGLSVKEYVLCLPIDQLVEIHISGPRRLEELDETRRETVMRNAQSISGYVDIRSDSLVDAHEPIRHEDLDLLAWVLDIARPRAVSLEYYKDARLLEAQLGSLNELLERDRGQMVLPEETAGL